MSEDELSDTPAGNTRNKLSSLGRRSFTPLTDRMRRHQSRSSENLTREPVKSSPRPPGKQKKNPSHKSSGSSTTRRRSPKQKENELYPNLDKYKGNLYPNLHENVSDDDNHNDLDSDENVDADIEDEVDFIDDSADQYDRQLKRKGISKYARNRDEPEALHESGNIRGREITVKPEFQGRPKDDAQTESNSWSVLIPVVAIIIIAIGLRMYLKQDQPQPSSTPTDDYYKLFKPHLDKIKAKYPSQSARFWRVVNSSIKRLLTEKTETYPAVLMFGIPKLGSETGTCISKDIINSLNKFFNSSVNGYIHSDSLNSESPEKMKLDLDEKLHKELDNGKGLVLDHIENLPAKTALLLHGYCDGDNAPYKSAAIILGLHVSSGKHLRDQDQYIESILNELWEDELGVDEMPALRSRIANSVTVVKPEEVVKC